MLLSGLGFAAYKTVSWRESIDGNWELESLYSWSIKYDWLSDSQQLMLVAACLSFLSLCVVAAGLIIVKHWINQTFLGDRSWRFSNDGLFFIYFILLLLITLEQIDLLILIC